MFEFVINVTKMIFQQVPPPPLCKKKQYLTKSMEIFFIASCKFLKSMLNIINQLPVCKHKHKIPKTLIN